MTFARISVIGLGYIGLPTAAMFASLKMNVIGVDISQSTVDTINRGMVHIVEPDLDIAVSTVVAGGYLRATTIPEPADAFLIAVPTPFKGEAHEPDLAYIQSACAMIAPVLRVGNLVVLESTSPVGATEQMMDWLAAARPDLRFPQAGVATFDVHIAHCPERVLPGRVMHELIWNDRIIGGLTPSCAARATALYKLFVRGECVTTNARTAEMAKLAENSFRDVNIAFANELSIVCDRAGIDPWELIALANRHPRVNILQPGPGVGGHCIAVDPWFIVAGAPNEARLIRAAREVNDSKPAWVIDKICSTVQASEAGADAAPSTIACYGLSFKADIDDLRESPSLEIVRKLTDLFPERVVAVEPNITAMPAALAHVPLIDYETAVAKAQVHVLLVDHRQFRESVAPNGWRVDTRGIWP